MKQRIIASFGVVFKPVWGISFPFESIVVSYLYILALLVILHNSLCGNEANTTSNLALAFEKINSTIGERDIQGIPL